MARTKPKPTALQDELVYAVVKKLPLPSKSWPTAEREAWFSMARNAFDVVYGVAERSRAIPAVLDVAASFATPQVKDARRFYVAPNSNVMCNGNPVKFSDVPPGTTLWDERTKPDRGYDLGVPPAFGLTDNIIWRDIGTHPKGELPAGVMMIAATTASPPDDADADGVSS